MGLIRIPRTREPLDLWVPLTNHRGALLVEPGDATEPEPGSIIMTEGHWGTAWQRHFNDGKWHSTRGGAPKQWDELIIKRNVVLVYDAAVRDTEREG